MTNYSGLWNREYGEDHALLGDRAKTNAHTALNRVFSGRNYDRASVKELLITLIDGDVGDTASASHKRVKARRDLSQNVQGGVVPIETHNAINRVTTSDDVDALVDALSFTSAPTTRPVDKSGNGGGAKLGY